MAGEPPRKRSKLVVAGAAAAVGAVGLTGLFAVTRIAQSSEGGAPTADELGTELMLAIENEDVLGMIDLLVPGERASLGDPFVELVGELQRLEVLSAEADLSDLVGLDVELTEELVQVRGTNVPDIVNVSMEAEALLTLDGAQLPVGALVEDQLPPDALTELRNTKLSEPDHLELELAAVLDGDRWYFSLFHTVAELAREESGGEPIPTEGLGADGADAPEAAVDRLLDHIEQLDLRGVIRTLDPAEARALQRYAPLFLDEADEVLADVSVDWRIDLREFRVEGDGAERTAFFDAIGVSGEIDGTEFSARYADGCLRAEADGETIEQCTGSRGEEVADLLADSPALERFLATLEEALADMEPVGLELRQRDGAWFVSPLATGTEALLKTMRALDRSEIDALIDEGEAAVEDAFDLFFGGFGMMGDPLLLDPYVEQEIVIEDVPADIEFPDSSAFDPVDECYQQTSTSDAVACFQAAVAAGDVDPMVVPVQLLYPECGLAELQWEGGLYQLDDEAFVAALSPAKPCFEALVESGELEEWAVPFEVLYFDCFEGRNWFSVYDDDYNERVNACMEESSPFGD